MLQPQYPHTASTRAAVAFKHANQPGARRRSGPGSLPLAAPRPHASIVIQGALQLRLRGSASGCACPLHLTSTAAACWDTHAGGRLVILGEGQPGCSEQRSEARPIVTSVTSKVN